MAHALDLILKQDARHRIVIGLAAASAVFFSLRGHGRVSTMIASWDTFAFFRACPGLGSDFEDAANQVARARQGTGC